MRLNVDFCPRIAPRAAPLLLRTGGFLQREGPQQRAPRLGFHNANKGLTKGARPTKLVCCRENKAFFSRAYTFFIVSANLFYRENKAGKSKRSVRMWGKECLKSKCGIWLFSRNHSADCSYFTRSRLGSVATSVAWARRRSWRMKSSSSVPSSETVIQWRLFICQPGRTSS